jgi:hypothetical protein
MFVQSNNEPRSCGHCYRGKTKHVTHFECVPNIALVIKHTTCMHHVILSSVASPALQDFSTLSHTHSMIWGGGGKKIH